MPSVKTIDGPGIKTLENLIKNLGKKVVKVGWFPSSRYDDKNATPVAYVASIQEFGYSPKKIPPRPFMRPTIADKKNEWAKISQQFANEMVRGEKTGEQALAGIGSVAEGHIRDMINTITTPALKESTIKARLRKRADKKHVGLLTKPLVDTGIMRVTLSSEVMDE